MKKIIILAFAIGLCLGAFFLFKMLLDGFRHKKLLGMPKKDFEKKYGCEFYNVYLEAMKNYLGYERILATREATDGNGQPLLAWDVTQIDAEGEEAPITLYSNQNLAWIEAIGKTIGFKTITAIQNSDYKEFQKAVIENLKYVAEKEGKEHVSNMWQNPILEPYFKTKMDSLGLDTTNEELKRIIKGSMQICVKNL